MTTVADEARIPTTHVGSLPRPERLRAYLADRSTGEALADPDFRELAADATEHVVRQQANAGIDIANNGEQARTGFHIHVTNRLTGFGDPAPAPFWRDVAAFPELADSAFDYPDADPATGAPRRPAVTGPIAYDGTAAARTEMELFRDAVAAVEHEFADLFMTAPSPGIVATSLPNDYYDTYEGYLGGLSDALATEYELLADDDVCLQIDAPELLHAHHRAFPGDRPAALADDRPAEEVVAMHVDAINDALPDVPTDRLRVHTCWGNYDGPHHLDVALDDVFPALLELDVGGLAVELASHRHEHEYAVLGEYALPDGFELLPGVVSVRSNTIEHPETVAGRLERVAAVIDDPHRLVATPNCGFGTLAWSAATEGIAWAKLESLVDGARLAGERLL